METCIFCKIVTGEIPCYKVYEDDKVLCFLDVNPVSQGHALIIPKKHFVNIFDINDEEAGHILKVASKIAPKIAKALEAPACNLVNASGKEAQQSVFHFHLHIIPRFENDGLDMWFHGKSESNIKEIIEKIKKEI